MPSSLTEEIFHYGNTDIHFVRSDEPLFVSFDVCRALNIPKPEWLNTLVRSVDILALAAEQESNADFRNALALARHLYASTVADGGYGTFDIVAGAFLLQRAWESRRLTSAVEQESAVSDRLAVAVQGKREVIVPSGRIDVLSATQVIEVKRAKQWRSGLGQVLDYGSFYPDREKRVHLFDVPAGFDFAPVLNACAAAGVVATWEQVPA